jgi:serine/threonine protein kinase
MAPEVIENEDAHMNDLSIDSTTTTTTIKSPIPYEESADLWSLGIITYELLAGATPFFDPNVTITKKRILSCDYTLPEHLHVDARDFIRHLLQYHRHERFKLVDVVEHNYLQTFAQKNFMNETLHQLASLTHHNTHGKSIESFH